MLENKEKEKKSAMENETTSAWEVSI